MSKRQEASARRTRQLWAARRAEAAGDPAATAQVRWDELRARVNDLPPKQQKAAWQEVAGNLRDQLANIAAERRRT